MTDILQTICDYARERVKNYERETPFSEVKRQALNQKGAGYAFEKAIIKGKFSLICEIKKSSPSKGVIDPVFDYLKIAADYQEGGADCISCLTEPKWFSGSDKILSEVVKSVKMPVLRKDFTVSAYQVYQSRLLGASAVLIIMSALKESEAAAFFEAAEETGLSAVFECRNEEQIERAQKIGARIIGVNNRNLKDFSVDTSKARMLSSLVDKDRIFISESGVMSVDDLRAQKLAGADAALVGEYCMRAKDRAAAVKEMKNV